MGKNDTRLTLSEVKGPFTDFLEKLDGENREEWLAGFKKFLRGENPRSEIEAPPAILKLISGGETIVLEPCDGVETLAQATDVFIHIGSDFKKWETDVTGKAGIGTTVAVYEVVQNATFAQIFTSLDDLGKLCLSQGQIKHFVQKYQKWLSGYATFFLFKVSNEFFVAVVRLYSSGDLGVEVDRFGFDLVWDVDSRHRVVVPQLAL